MTDPKETDPLSYQVGGDHYKKYEYQPIEFFNDVRLDFNRANAIKYIARWRQKNGVEDLKKAVQYLRFAAQEGLKVADNALRFLKQFKGPEYEIIDNILAGCVIDARKDIEDMIAREEAKAQADDGDHEPQPDN